MIGKKKPEVDIMEEKLRILAVDDEPDLRALLGICLRTKGWEVVESASGSHAVELLRNDRRFDLVIMDIMMPGMDGVAACAAIREFSSVPVLFLTAKSQLADKADAYASGGDAYLVKPFSREELTMKAESLIRRYRTYKGKQEMQEADGLTLDEEHRCILRGGEPIELTEKEYAIARYFFANRGKVVDIQTVYESVWGEKFLPASNNTVMVHILNLRKKLEADPANPKLIKTVWGKGYRFG